MNTRSQLSPAARDAVLDALLRQHPDAWVVAIVPTGHFTAMPPEVPVSRHRVIEGPFSALDLVTSDDRTVVIDAWHRTLAEGGDNIQVHPLNDPDRLISLHFVDVRHRYGVILGFFVGFAGEETPQAISHADLVPRTSVIRKDQLAVIIDVDPAASAILGWSREELVGRRSLDIVHPDDHERAIANWMDMVGRPGAIRRVRLRHQHKDGTFRWLEVTNTNKLDRPDDPHVLADMVDVTDEVTALEALRANEQLLRRLTEALPVGVLTIGVDRRITYCNESCTAIVGATDGSTVDDKLENVGRQDRDAVRAAVVGVLYEGRDSDLEVSFHPPGAKTHRCVMSLRALISDAGAVTGAIICLADITDEVNLREELQRQVRFDPLTACLNHASILAALEDRLAQPSTDSWTVVLFIDLDDFKGVNDRHGHVAGDRLLKSVAARLGRVAGDTNLVGRLGGDEFLMVVRTEPDLSRVSHLAGCVAAALAEPLRLGHEWTVPKASIGAAYSTAADGLDADALVSAADTAMYEAKRVGDSVPVVTRAKRR
ncbi:MAG: diguanylate cyclase domain-containing protein [Betaproteobacteria bacterium]